jgi:hypothetical protein
MRISEIKEQLTNLENVTLCYQTEVLFHFHVTEVGLVTKNFIDCGGKVRMKLW